jgi:hypothetical protein
LKGGNFRIQNKTKKVADLFARDYILIKRIDFPPKLAEYVGGDGGGGL